MLNRIFLSLAVDYRNLYSLTLLIKATGGLNLRLSQWKITISRYNMAAIIITTSSAKTDKMQEAIVCPDGATRHVGGSGIWPGHFNYHIHLGKNDLVFFLWQVWNFKINKSFQFGMATTTTKKNSNFFLNWLLEKFLDIGDIWYWTFCFRLLKKNWSKEWC